MSELPVDKQRIKEEIGAAFRQAWVEDMANDVQTPELELLAAYAEGRLDEGDRRAVENLIQQSPVALEIIETLGGTIPGTEKSLTLALAGTDSANASKRLSTTYGASDRHAIRRPFARYWPLATAASLLIATLATLYGWQSSNKLQSMQIQISENQAAIAQLQNSLQMSTANVVQSQKERLSQLVANHQPVYLSGASSPEMVRLALESRGRKRSAAIPAEESDSIGAASRELSSSIQQLSNGIREPKLSTAQIELAAVYLVANDLSNADKVLVQLENKKSGPTPAVSNLRGAWMVAKAASLKPAEAEPLLTQAASLFQQAAEAGEVDAWLNMALLSLERNQLEEARAAAGKYMSQTPDPERREMVRRALSM